MSLRDVGQLAPTVPAALRQEIARVLRENLIESKASAVDCGVLAYGQTSVLASVAAVTKTTDDSDATVEGKDDGGENIGESTTSGATATLRTRNHVFILIHGL